MRKGLKKIVSVLLAFVMVLGVVGPMSFEAKAADDSAPDYTMDTLAWTDFVLLSDTTVTLTYDTTFTDATELYCGSGYNNKAFEDGVIFAQNAWMVLGNTWHGIQVGVNSDGQFVVKGSSYTNAGNLFEYKCNAEDYGLTSFVDTQFTLRIEMKNVTSSTADCRVFVNGMLAGEKITLTQGSGGQAIEAYGAICRGDGTGAVTIKKKVLRPDYTMEKISWTNFGLTSSPAVSLTYDTQFSSATEIYCQTGYNNKAFEDGVSFAQNAWLTLGNTWHGLQVGVNSDGQFVVKGNNYTNAGSMFEYKCNAADYGLDTFIGKQFTLRIEMKNVTSSTADCRVFVNEKIAGEEITLTQGAGGQAIEAYGAIARGDGTGSVTIVKKIILPDEAMPTVSWQDFKNGETVPAYGTKYTSQVSLYTQTNLNNKAFVDAVQFEKDAWMNYASGEGWHGLWLGVNSDGQFTIKGTGYGDGSKTLNYTYEAADFGLDSFVDTPFNLRIEMRDATKTTARVRVFVEGEIAGDEIMLTRTDDAAQLIGQYSTVHIQSTGAMTILEKFDRTPTEPALTEITWKDFSGATYGKTYSTATGLTYSGSNMNNTAFEDRVSFSADSSVIYATSNGWHGLRVGVNATGELHVNPDNYDVTSGSVGTYPASTFGETTLIDKVITLRIEMRDVTDTTARIKVFVNGTQAGEEFSIARPEPAGGVAALGNQAYFCEGGRLKNAVTIPELPLTDITWADFCVSKGTTYDVQTKVDYTGASMTETAFEDYVKFSAGSSIRYATTNGWHGLQLGVNADGKFFIKGQGYFGVGEDAVYDASTFNLTQLTNKKIKLRIEMRDVTETTARVKVFVNDVQAGSELSLTSAPGASALGNTIGICVYDETDNDATYPANHPVTVPTDTPDWTNITWADFGVAVGTEFKAQTQKTYSGSSMDYTIFEDKVVFVNGSSIRYATTNGWHGLQLGVNKDGKFFITGQGYTDNGADLVYTYPASDFGLTTLENQELTLKIEMYDVTDTTAQVKVWVNGTQAGEEMSLVQREGGYGNLGNVMGICVYDEAQSDATYAENHPVAVPEPPLTEISWADFSNVTYGKTYTAETAFTYSGSTMNNTAFEDVVAFSADSSILYAGANSWHGLRVGVNAEGKFFAKGDSYLGDAGTFDASTFGLTSLVDARIKLRIEMRDVTETTARVKVFVNGIQAGNEFTIQRANDGIAALSNQLYVCGGGSATGPVTIFKTVAVPTGLNDVTWEDFGFTGGQTYSTTLDRQALHFENLNNTLFDGDIMFAEGSHFRYAASSGWLGIQLQGASDGFLQIDPMGAGHNLPQSKFNPKHFGLESFVGERFNLKIAMTDYNGTSATYGIWVNGQIVGDYFTYTAASETAAFGNHMFLPTGGSITPYSTKTSVPTGLTNVTFTDWKADLEGYLRHTSGLTGANPNVSTLVGTSFKETVKFVVPEGETAGHMLCYGGDSVNNNLWYGMRILFDSDNHMVIRRLNPGVVDEFVLSPQVAGLDSFINTEFTWQIDTVALGENVLVYVSFNGKLYNNAPFVLYNYADAMSNTIEYTSYDGSSDRDALLARYIVLGSSTKTLPTLYHDLSEGVYTLPSGCTELQQYIGITWTVINIVGTLDTAGEYQIAFNDGVSDYIQKVQLYTPGDVSAVDLVRAMKLAEKQEGVEYKKVCDIDVNGIIDKEDVKAIRSDILNDFLADTSAVMPLVGFWGPRQGTDATYQLIKAAGINQIVQGTGQYTDVAGDRYKVYTQLALAQKYDIDLVVDDGRLSADPSNATQTKVQNAIANYKDYQSFGGLYVVDEPRGSAYPANTSDRTITKYAPLAKAVNADGIFGFGNLNPYVYTATQRDGVDSSTVRQQGLYEYATYVREFADQTNAKYLSFDHYLFHTGMTAEGNMGGSVEKASRWFENLGMVRYIANEENIPFWTFIQIGDGYEWAGAPANNPSEGEVKWQANTALAFGAKGLQYFPMVNPGWTTDTKSGLIDGNGNTTEWYAYAQDINAQVAAIDGVLMGATNEGLMSTGGYAKSQATDYVDSMALKKKGWISYNTVETMTTPIHTSYNGATVTSSDSSYGALTGCFTTADGKHALYIVNYNVNAASTVTVSFTSNTDATIINNAVKTTQSGTSMNIQLGAGEAALVVY